MATTEGPLNTTVSSWKLRQGVMHTNRFLIRLPQLAQGGFLHPWKTRSEDNSIVSEIKTISFKPIDSNCIIMWSALSKNLIRSFLLLNVLLRVHQTLLTFKERFVPLYMHCRKWGIIGCLFTRSQCQG